MMPTPPQSFKDRQSEPVLNSICIMTQSCIHTQIRRVCLSNGLKEQAIFTAIEIAMRDSVTVSMGDDTRGAFSEIFFVRADVKS